MMKRIIPSPSGRGTEKWLDAAAIAAVEVTSEDSEHPIEHALDQRSGTGWRAGTPGPQVIRLVFRQPRIVQKIRLRFQQAAAHTHEFSLSWAKTDEEPPQTIIRQQWTFSPSGSTAECEEYNVNLDGVSVLQLAITADIGDAAAIASVEEFLVASPK